MYQFAYATCEFLGVLFIPYSSGLLPLQISTPATAQVAQVCSMQDPSRVSTMTKSEQVQSELEEILVHGGKETLFQCMLVSKEWYRKITSESFLERVIAHSSIFVADSLSSDLMTIKFEEGTQNFIAEDFQLSTVQETRFHEILGSSGGLVCVSVGDDKHRHILIINPKTRLCRRIPAEGHDGGLDGEIVKHSYAFGYDEENRDHKIVRFHTICPEIGDRRTYANIFSLGGTNWKRKEYPNFSLPSTLTHTIGSLNGRLMWYASEQNKLVTFDLSSQVLGVIDLPHSLYRRIVDFDVMSDMVMNKFCEDILMSYSGESGWTSLWKLTMTGNNIQFNRVAYLVPTDLPFKALCYLNGDENALVLQEGNAINGFNVVNHSRINVHDGVNDQGRRNIAAIAYLERDASLGGPRLSEFILEVSKHNVLFLNYIDY